MLAARLVAPGRIECDDVPDPVLEPGSLLVRTEFAAVCGSDVHAVVHGIGPTRYPCPPGYPGHEAVGVVLASDDPRFAEGERVLTVPDHRWARCFAELQVLPGAFAVAVPKDANPEIAVFGQQLGTVIHALNHFWPERADERVASVVGAGPAGLLFVQLLRERGFRPIVAGDQSEHRAAVAARIGAEAGVHVSDGGEFIKVVMDFTSGRGADLSVDASGSDMGRAIAIRAIADRGVVGCFGLPERHGLVPFPFETLFDRRATLRTTFGAQHEHGLHSFQLAVAAITSGRVDVTQLLTHRVGIADVRRALELASTRADGAIKVGVTFTTEKTP